jgi:GNAT superfamily N-acetyltransferase
MDEKYQILPMVQPDDALWKAVGGGIHAFNDQQAGENEHKFICYAIHDEEDQIAGGIIAETYWDWLYINLLFLKEELRGQGYGHKLLTLAEEEGRRRGARHAYLDTFSFQAPDFYKQHGYRVFGELADFPTGHQRYFLTKDL